MTKKSYAGIPEKYTRLDDAKVVLIPVPYDGTSAWQKGSYKGPDAFLTASENLELFDIETRSEPYKKGIYLTPPVTENTSPEKMVETVYRTTKNYINQDKFVTVFGGEHSISIGTTKAFNECFEDLTVVQIDAHANLRASFEGSKYSHACAFHEASKTGNLIQIGVRSMDISELDYIDENQAYFAHDMLTDDEWMDDAVGQMTPNVFISIDLDAFDPSVVPSTGNPEPGGLLWYETLEFLKDIFKKKNVVGFEIVELCPNPSEKSSDFVAAKLYYKMLAYKFKYLNKSKNEE